ncbi:FG-GAP repeat domain-containing protein [Halarchaeum sp. P4]|uniref:FG-GAP repeat domain-containing protein n=1 Tax=Halarchaeum sp. P4 TaxID=3421639 RepID=UPI003EB781D2
MHGGRPTDESTREERRDRGQLLLIAGLGIAVAFVALALVVNSVVFTHNLATRPAPDGGEAMEYQHIVVEGVGGVVSETNSHHYTGHGNLRDALRGDVQVWSNLTLHHYGAFGTLTNVSVHDVTNGTSIHQATARSFTDRGGKESWTLFSGANGARRFKMNVTDTTGPLTVETGFADGSTVSVTVEEDASGNIQVTNSGTGQTCSASAPATVDFSNASVDGAHCSALDFFGSGTVSELGFSNGDAVTGRYVVVANATPEGLYTSENYTDHYYTADSPSPYALPAVYAATLNVTYRGPDVTYATRVRVRPNATPQGPRYGVVPLRGQLVFSFANDPKNLATVDALGGISRFAPTNASVIGPRKYDFTDDSVQDVPYVDSAQAVHIANASGTMELTTGADATKSLLAVGSWNNTHPSIFYTSGDTVYRVRPGTASESVFSDTNDGVSAVAGVGDIDGDGADEFVYVDDSQQLRYLENDGSLHKVDNGGAGASTGLGVGAPVDVDGDGHARVPMVDGSNNLWLVGANSRTKVLSGNVDKSPVAAYDADGDGQLELLYLNNGQIWYADHVLGSPTRHQFENASGGAIVADKATGVA